MHVRQDSVMFRSKPMSHFFDCPLQLAAAPEHSQVTDSASNAFTTELRVQPGDLLIAGSDGLWDNMHPHEVLAILRQHPGNADKVCPRAGTCPGKPRTLYTMAQHPLLAEHPICTARPVHKACAWCCLGRGAAQCALLSELHCRPASQATIRSRHKQCRCLIAHLLAGCSCSSQGCSGTCSGWELCLAVRSRCCCPW